MAKFDFIGKRNIFFTVSAVLVLICIGSLIFKGLNFGIDFNGGTIIQIDLHTQFETSEIREITDTIDEDAEITYAGENESQLVINTQKDLSNEQVNELFSVFKDKYDLKEEDLLSSEKVSGSIGSEMTNQALIACGIAILLMMLYISFRFELLFGISAFVALVHDILIVLGMYSIFEIQVNSPFIAAILTILGYSVNDTIIVFDRIRENRKRYKKTDLDVLVNDSIVQTLGRTINTTVTTLLAILAIFILGSQSIRDFVLPLVVGFIAGSYSSIFIANTLWYVLEKRKLESKA